MNDFSAWMSRGFKAWTDHFKDWIWPSAKAGLIFLACYLCLCIPGYIAIGPLAVGMFACAFHALEGWGPNADALSVGKDRLGDAVMAWFLKALALGLPILVLISVCFLPMFVAIMGTSSGGQQQPPDWMGPMMAGGMCLYWIGLIVIIVVSTYLQVRWIFVYPLIADKEISGLDALKESWRMTQGRFWPLLLLHWLGSMVASLGIYACYVGAIFTAPAYFCLVGAAYLSITRPQQPAATVDPVATMPGSAPPLPPSA